MRRAVLIGVTVAALGGAAMLNAQAGRSAEVRMKAAQQKADVEGDLKGAIEEYRKVVASAGTNRTLAAQALVRMAECYQKLGDTQARSIYERVAREYADQKEFAALAHARLGAGEAARMTSRRVTTVPVGGVGYGTVSPDGRYFPYTNWDTGDLYLRDLVTGANRRLTSASALAASPSQFAGQAAFSRDGRHVAYHWFVGRRHEIRVVDAVASDPVPRRIFENNEIADIWPDDWSPDGKWLAVQARRPDTTAQIGLLAIHDGSFRVLKSVDWRGARRLIFSPDGKYLAYDLPVSNTATQRDVFILACDGSREVAAIVHPGNDVVMGWSPDGSRLLFASDRSGTVGLWQLPVGDGKPIGGPELIKSNVEGAPLGVGRNGALYSLVHHPRFSAAVSSNIHVAPFDFDTGRILSAPTAPVQSFVGTNNNPAWSPDGKHLAYVSRRDEPTGGTGTREQSIVMVIRSVETDQARELRPPLNLFAPMVRWSADGRSLITHARDVKGRRGLYRIDAQTGAVSAIAVSTDDTEMRNPSESPDGKKIFFVRGYVGQPDKDLVVIERNLSDGIEREVVRGRRIFAPGTAPLLSPDGRWVIVWRATPETSALLAVAAAGSQPSEIIRVETPQRVTLHGWTPDGRAILAKIQSGSASELWRVPLDGSPRRKLPLDVSGMNPFSVHPDGRQVAYAMTEPARDDEIWVLENFLSAPNPRR